MKKTEPEYYPPVENLLDLIYEHYTENNPVEKNTVAGKAAKAKECARVRPQCWELSVNLRTLNRFTCSLKIK